MGHMDCEVVWQQLVKKMGKNAAFAALCVKRMHIEAVHAISTYECPTQRAAMACGMIQFSQTNATGVVIHAPVAAFVAMHHAEKKRGYTCAGVDGIARGRYTRADAAGTAGRGTRGG